MLHIKLKTMKHTTTYKLIFNHTHTLDSRGEVKRSKHFSENGHAAYQIKGNDTYNNMHATLLHLYTHSTHGMWSKGENIFSEHVHVTYQIKGNETYDQMQANSLPLHTLLTPGVRSKGRNISLKEAMLRKVGHAYTMVIYTMAGLLGRFLLSR